MKKKFRVKKNVISVMQILQDYQTNKNIDTINIILMENGILLTKCGKKEIMLEQHVHDAIYPSLTNVGAQFVYYITAQGMIFRC